MKTKEEFELLHEHRNSIVRILNRLRIKSLCIRITKKDFNIILKETEKELLNIENRIRKINFGSLQERS